MRGIGRRVGRSALLALVGALTLVGAASATPSGATVTAVTAETVTAAAPSAAAPSGAPSAANEGNLSIAVTSISPTVAGYGQVVTVTGTVHNTGISAVTVPRVDLLRSTATIITREGVTTWAAGTSHATGQLLGTAEIATPIPGGGHASFRIEVPKVSSLGTSTWGVLPVSVEAGPAVLHTFLGYQRIKEYEPLRTAWLVPLTLDPDPALWGPPGAARDAAWQQALGPGSRLDRLITATEASPVTWAIDPILLHPATAPPTGSSAAPSPSSSPSTSPAPSPSTSASPNASPSGSSTLAPTAATSAEEATLRTDMADRLASLAGQHGPVVLPQGDADVAVAGTIPGYAAPLTSLVTSGTATAAALGGRADIAWPAGGTWTPQVEKGITGLYAKRPAAVVLPRSALPGIDPAVGATARTTSGTPLLLEEDSAEPALTQAMSDHSENGVGAATEQVVATTAIVLGERPGVSRDLLLAVPRGIDASSASAAALFSAIDTVPWLTATPFSGLVADGATAPQTSATGGPIRQATSALRQLTPATYTELQRSATVAAQIRGDGEIVGPRWASAVTELLSARWRDHLPAWTSVEKEVSGEVHHTIQAVHVAPQTITFLADRGRVQVTVVNDLEVEVHDVTVDLIPDNPRLRIDSAPTTVRIGPHSRTTTAFDATALAAGPVRLAARIYGPNGVEVGRATIVSVTVTPTGAWIYWGLGGVAALVFGLGILRNLRRRRRRGSPGGRRARPEPAPDPGGGRAVTTRPAASSGSATVARSGAIMAAGTMTSRILGVLRASLLAGVIGTNGLVADSFQTANTLPNQFYLLLAGGILNAVLVPQLVRATRHEDGGADFVNRLLTAALILITAATVLATALAPVLVRVYFDANDPRAITLATTFAFICLPQIFFYGLYTMLGQVLNAHSRFAAYMWVPALANVVAIAGLLWFRAEASAVPVPLDGWSPRLIWILAGTSTLSIGVQAIALVIPLRRIGFRFRPRWGFRGFGLGSASRVAKWTFAAVVVAQLGFVLTSRVTSSAARAVSAAHPETASRATFDNAFLIFMLPHSLITVSLVTALFTRMAHAASAGDRSALVADVRRGIRMPALLLFPLVAIAIAFAPTITRTLYFTNSLADTQALASMVRPLLFGVIPYGWFYLSERFFYAHEDARTPFIAQLTVTSVATAVTAYAATLDPTRTSIVVAAGQSVAYLCGAILGFSLIRRSVGLLGLRSVAATLVKLAVPAIVIAAALWLLTQALVPSVTPSRGGGRGVLAVVGTVELGGTLAVAHLLGVTEVSELLAPVRRRLRRS